MADYFSSLSATTEPLVSVCVTAYNHAPYIAQCLDSILAQECDFGVEIVLGED
ncbi:MAG: glycosyltransferase, partial [Alistipes sp.]|nr:glycosyltransferase [Alistipes sp.]